MESRPNFIPSKRFNGAKQGYFFKNDKQGLGYYLDVNKPNKYLTTDVGRKRKFEESQSSVPDSSTSNMDKVEQLKSKSDPFDDQLFKRREPSSSTSNSQNQQDSRDFDQKARLNSKIDELARQEKLSADQLLEEAEKTNANALTQLDVTR
jgi:hypothetical protein